MTTPQVIQWTHVDDEAPPTNNFNVIGKLENSKAMAIGLVKKDIDSLKWGYPNKYRIFHSLVWLPITHWAIIAPPEVKK